MRLKRFLKTYFATNLWQFVRAYTPSIGFQFNLKSLKMSYAHQDTCVISRSVCITCNKLMYEGQVPRAYMTLRFNFGNTEQLPLKP